MLFLSSLSREARSVLLIEKNHRTAADDSLALYYVSADAGERHEHRSAAHACRGAVRPRQSRAELKWNENQGSLNHWYRSECLFYAGS